MIVLLHIGAVAGGLWLLKHRDLAIRWQPLQAALILSALVGSFLFYFSDPPSPLQDFRDAYYAAGAAVQDGPQGLSPLLDKGVDGFVNLPIVAYLFWPFGLLPELPAALLFSLLGVACCLWSWSLLSRLAGLDERHSAVLLFLFAANGPLIYGFKEGNTSHFILLLLVLALTSLRSGRQAVAGALLAVAAIVKPPLLILGAYFLYRRNWRTVAGGGVTIAAAAAASLGVFGWDTHRRWYELCIKPFGEAPIPAFNVQSVQAFVLRFQTGAEGLFDWTPVPLTHPLNLYSAVLVVVSCLLAGAIVLLRARSAQADLQDSITERDVQVLLALTCIVSPVSWSHYYTWFLLPLAYIIPTMTCCEAAGGRRFAWIIVLMLSTAVVGDTWQVVNMPSPIMQIATSCLLFGGILWMLSEAWRTTGDLARRDSAMKQERR